MRCGTCPTQRLLLEGRRVAARAAARSLGPAMAQGTSRASEAVESAAQAKDSHVAHRTRAQLDVKNIEGQRVPEVPSSWLTRGSPTYAQKLLGPRVGMFAVASNSGKRRRTRWISGAVRWREHCVHCTRARAGGNG